MVGIAGVVCAVAGLVLFVTSLFFPIALDPRAWRIAAVCAKDVRNAHSAWVLETRNGRVAGVCASDGIWGFWGPNAESAYVFDPQGFEEHPGRRQF
jgi:hypothetical protein